MIVAGFGFRSTVEVKSLQAALKALRSDHQIDKVATLEDKSSHPAFQSFAQKLDLPVDIVSNASLDSIRTETESAASRAARQTGSVAEAAALLAAGPGATLIQARVVSPDRMATCALAQSQKRESDL